MNVLFRNMSGGIGLAPKVASRPHLDAYDVVTIGGATSGSSIAWHLVADPGFAGTVLVVEADTICSLRRFDATK